MNKFSHILCGWRYPWEGWTQLGKILDRETRFILTPDLKTYHDGQVFSCHLVYAFIHLNDVQVLQEKNKYSSEEKKNSELLLESKALQGNATCGWPSSGRKISPCNPFAFAYCFSSSTASRPAFVFLCIFWHAKMGRTKQGTIISFSHSRNSYHITIFLMKWSSLRYINW